MKLNTKCKIESAASKDKTRYSITAPWLDIDENGAKVIATDGRIMAVVPVQVNETDKSCHLSIDALKASRKGRLASGEIDTSGEMQQVTGGGAFPREDLGNAPNWRQVMPEEKAPVFTVALNPALLARLAEAMGTDAVKLEFTSETSPIRVTPTSGGNGTSVAEPGAVGVIMPCRM
jgi:DNA polymerase III sliding clamp (beta) subunit (PCNA family)